jgi:hypothetical protein
VDLGLIEPFSQEIIGDNEMMLSDTAMRFLNISDVRKGKVELMFDFKSIIQTYSSDYSETEGKVEGEIQSMIRKMLPTKEDIYEIINS